MEAEAERGLTTFVRNRLAEGSAPYCRAFEDARPIVARLFAQTQDLLNLATAASHEEASLNDALRYLFGPPLSKDDLATLTKNLHSELTTKNNSNQAILALVQKFIDPFRFPWLKTGAQPSPAARQAAIDWTTSLWAVERCRTRRRMESSKAQERLVRQMLGRECQLVETQGIRAISALDEIERGHFAGETILANAKADVVVRLKDGRVLAIECKVSNSAINSVKRLNRETVGKAEKWRTRYGLQVITAAVLAGVFKVGDLLEAQQAGVAIFWEHDLAPLRDFVNANKP